MNEDKTKAEKENVLEQKKKTRKETDEEIKKQRNWEGRREKQEGEKKGRMK